MLRYYTFDVIDKSGSMNEDCSRQLPGYRRIDFARHGCKLCVMACPENMQKSIIVYDSDARVLVPMSKINGQSKAEICSRIDSIQPSGGTNLMAAFRIVRSQVMDILATLPDDETRVKQLDRITVMAFTDGQDMNTTYETVGGAMDDLMVPIGAEKHKPFKLEFIGFGSDIITPLATKMVALSRPGSHFVYLNDSSVVGTVFGRALVRIYMGQEAYGLRTVLPAEQEAQFHVFRKKIATALKTDPLELETLFAEMRAHKEPHDGLAKLYTNIIEHLESQVMLAMKNEAYYKTWGQPYIAMMADCFDQQYSPGFKEVGLECFGSARVYKEYEVVKQIYEKMPVLQPTGNTRGYQAMDAATFAATCSNPDAGCWHPSSLIQLATGESISFDELENRLEHGPQQVLTGNGSKVAEVFRLVRMPVQGPQTFYKMTDGCWLTPGHPIMSSQSEWIHPKTQNTVVESPGHIYNIVLDPANPYKDSVWVGGVRCLAWGHGIQEDPVATHDFFGQEIVEMLGRRKGPVVVLEGRFLRDPATDWVSSYEDEGTVGAFKTSLDWIESKKGWQIPFCRNS